MRILVVTRSTPLHQIGGMENVAWDIAKGLGELGHEVTVLTTAVSNLQKIKLNELNFKLEFLKECAPGIYSRRWWKSSLAYFKDNETSFDLVFSVSVAAKSIAAYKERKIRVIIQSHGTLRGEMISKLKSQSIIGLVKMVKNLLELPFHKNQYSKFDHFIAVGDRVYNDLQKWPSRVNKSKISLIRNGIRRPRSEELHGVNAKRKGMSVVCVSRLHKQKGVQKVINLFQNEKLSHVSLTIIGDGEYRSVLEAQAKGYDNIIFVGKIAYNDIYRELSKHNAFIFISNRIEAGYTLTMLEAAAAKLPIVVSDYLAKQLPFCAGVYSISNDNTEDCVLTILNALEGEVPTLPEDYYLDRVLASYDDFLAKAN